MAGLSTWLHRLLRGPDIELVKVETRTMTLAELDRMMDQQVSGIPTASSVPVSEYTALQSTAVYACTRVLAETVASLPLPVYRRLPGGGKQRDYGHPLYPILQDEANPEMSAFSFWETMMGHILLWGNAYAQIERTPAKVTALWPMRPDRMKIRRDPGGLTYVYKKADSTEVEISSDFMLHIPGLAFDGVMGYSPIALAREAIGLAQATEEFGARFFGNDARPGIVLQHPGVLSPEAKTYLAESWASKHQGVSRSHRPAVLQEGMTIKEIGIPPEDAQFLETRQWQLNEIARVFRVPPHLIGDLSKATFSNIEHQSIDFVVHSVRPWLVRIEQAIKRSLFLPSERSTWFAEFLVDGLLRGDIAGRYAAYAIGRNGGWLCPNDILEKENMNPLPGEQGNIYLVPLNMVPADQLTSSAASPAALPARAIVVREIRVADVGKGRKKLRGAYEPLFRAALDKVVRREHAEVLEAARKHFNKRDMGTFLLWLNDYYREYPAVVSQGVGPLLRAYAELVDADAAAEIDAEADMSAALEAFAKQMADDYGAEYAGSSQGQLTSVLSDASVAGESELDAVTGRLDEWNLTRALKLAGIIAVGASDAFAKHTYRRSGIVKLRWHANAGACPYCAKLDGKVVGIDDLFAHKGSDVSADGVDVPLKPGRNIGHAPLHGACVCWVGAERS